MIKCGEPLLVIFVVSLLAGFFGIAGLQRIDRRYQEITEVILHEQKIFFDTQNANTAEILNLKNRVDALTKKKKKETK